MTLQESVRFFTEEAQVLASLDLKCGDADKTYRAMGGVMNLAGDPLIDNALYDLASLTKLMTGMMIMRLWEDGALDISAPVARYASQFENLTNVSVDEVLGFEKSIQTPGRVDAKDSREEGLQVLFQARAEENVGRRMYSDMHAMVLKYVIEGASGKSYMAFLRETVLDPLGMHDTFCQVPDADKTRCVSYDFEHRIEGEKWICRSGIKPGTPHDPKCRTLNLDGNDCPGHAGLFSTSADMEKFCRGVLDGKVIRHESLLRMSRNRTGKQLTDGSYTQYLGSQSSIE